MESNLKGALARISFDQDGEVSGLTIMTNEKTVNVYPEDYESYSQMAKYVAALESVVALIADEAPKGRGLKR